MARTYLFGTIIGQDWDLSPHFIREVENAFPIFETMAHSSMFFGLDLGSGPAPRIPQAADIAAHVSL